MDRVKIQQVIYGAKNRRGPSCTDADEDGHQFDRNRGTRHHGLFSNYRTFKRCRHQITINGEGSRGEYGIPYQVATWATRILTPLIQNNL